MRKREGWNMLLTLATGQERRHNDDSAQGESNVEQEEHRRQVVRAGAHWLSLGGILGGQVYKVCFIDWVVV